MTVEATTKDKQITIDVPQDRVAEFYAFYGHFLAGSRGRRRRDHGPGGHGCRPRREEDSTVTETAATGDQPQPARSETTSI